MTPPDRQPGAVARPQISRGDAELAALRTRSAAALTASAASRAARRRRAQPSGWWGMALFLGSELTIFGVLIGTYFYLEFRATHWPATGIAAPATLVPAIATGCLVAMSIPMWLAARQARAGRAGRVLALTAFALAVQLGYLATQIVLFRKDLLQFQPHGSAYASIYYTLLAADHAHVLLGIVLDVTVIFFVAVRGLRNYWLIGARGLALYWYVVNALTVAVLLTTLSPSL